MGQRTILAIPSDTHAGSPYGLCPIDGWQYADGGKYLPSYLQELIALQWEECWEAIRGLRQDGDRLIVVHNGDATEGLHHNSSQVASMRADEHTRMHLSMMRRGLAMAKYSKEAGDQIYYIAGTTSHVMSGAITEEAISRELEAMPYNSRGVDGRYVWPKLRIEINGTLFDIAHHGPSAGARTWLLGNNMRYAIRSVYYQAIENGIPVPDHYVRSHRHRWIDPETHKGRHGTITGYITPSFKISDEYVFAVASDALANVGMLIFIIEENGETRWICPRIEIEQSEIVKL